jgi:hypothetical protein
MPTIFIERYRFRFYASDVGEPPHVHVIDAEKVAKVGLQPIRIESNRGYSATQLNYVLKLTRQNQTKLSEAWNDYFTR